MRCCLMCPYIQAIIGCLGAISLCRHDDIAEVQLHEAPRTFSGSAYRGKCNCNVWSAV